MEYFLVRYASRVVIYERRGFIRLATGERASETFKFLDVFLAKKQ